MCFVHAKAGCRTSLAAAEKDLRNLRRHRSFPRSLSLSIFSFSLSFFLSFNLSFGAHALSLSLSRSLFLSTRFASPRGSRGQFCQAHATVFVGSRPGVLRFQDQQKSTRSLSLCTVTLSPSFFSFSLFFHNSRVERGEVLRFGSGRALFRHTWLRAGDWTGEGGAGSWLLPCQQVSSWRGFLFVT